MNTFAGNEIDRFTLQNKKQHRKCTSLDETRTHSRTSTTQCVNEVKGRAGKQALFIGNIRVWSFSESEILFVFFLWLMNLPSCRFRMWICLSRDRGSDVRQIHNAQAGWAGRGGVVLDGGGEETGQMNSTCRGEGEGLNCKTRRQRSCALKACRHKRCVVGGAGGEGRLGGVCTLGEAGRCVGGGAPNRLPVNPQSAERQTGRLEQPAGGLQECEDSGKKTN